MSNNNENKSELTLEKEKVVFRLILLENQMKDVSERISSHKEANNEGFIKIGEAIQRIEQMLVPKDSEKKGLPERIRNLEDLAAQVKAIWLLVIGWLIDLVLRVFFHIK